MRRGALRTICRGCRLMTSRAGACSSLFRAARRRKVGVSRMAQFAAARVCVEQPDTNRQIGQIERPGCNQTSPAPFTISHLWARSLGAGRTRGAADFGCPHVESGPETCVTRWPIFASCSVQTSSYSRTASRNPEVAKRWKHLTVVEIPVDCTINFEWSRSNLQHGTEAGERAAQRAVERCIAEKGNGHPDGPLMIPAPAEARDKEERKQQRSERLRIARERLIEAGRADC